MLNEKVVEGAPESYADFRVPEDYTLDPEVAKEVGTIFKELNLPQESAQRLVDFYIAKTQETFQQPYKAYTEMRDGWRNEIMNDKELGGKLSQVKLTIARAIDGLGDPKLATSFREAMDYTGAGDNPAFIRAFYKLAQKVTEGTHVQGRGPTEPGTRAPDRPQTAAKAMYPNLP